MKTFRALLLTVALLALAVVPSFAQTTISSTTLAAAVAATDRQVQLTSVTGVAVGDYLVVLGGNRVREVMRVRAINSPYVEVTRNTVPTNDADRALSHAALAPVYFGVRGRLYSSDVAGTCTAANERFLPHINPETGNVSQCSPAGVWYRLDQTFTVPCRMLLIADMVDQSCWTVNGNYVLVGATYVAKVAEAGGTLTVRIMREQGTEAAAAGDLLATAWNAVTTGIAAETVTAATLSATSSFLLLSSGERLGVDFTDDTAGELAGVTITFTVAPR